MKLNIFEGARRISLLIGALWVVGVSAYAFFSKPYDTVTFAFFIPGDAPAVIENCPIDAATQYLERKTPDGKTINIKFCFFALKADTGGMLVPYADDGNGKLWNRPAYSTEVQQYTALVASKFSLTPEGIAAHESTHRKALLKQWGVAAMFLLGGLAVGWAVVAAIGWIVRGFMGIPRGQDMRLPN